MNLVEVKVEIPRAMAVIADEALLELQAESWSVLEDVIAQRAWIIGICSSEAEAERSWEDLVPNLNSAGVTLLTPPVRRVLADADWRDSYKSHFKAWKFGRLNWVPVWERDAFVLSAGEEVLWLDPGMAFGTGNHETTRLVVESIVKFTERHGTGGRVIDAGCGSGILALSAAKLGFGEILGFDNDPEAVRVSQENASMNGLAGRIHFFVGDLISGLHGKQADLLLANIQADVLMRFAAGLCSAVAPEGELVLSGILEKELGPVRAHFAAIVPGWRSESQVLGEWSGLVFIRPA